MIVTFCGHSEIAVTEPLKNWLRVTIDELIEQGAEKFLLGGYGNFDDLAASAVWEAKKQHSDIKSVLVVPYLDKKVYAKKYDYTTYPPLELVPRRFAISKRNDWMVDAADVVVANVNHDWGGAYTMLAYAIRKKKVIRNYADEKR